MTRLCSIGIVLSFLCAGLAQAQEVELQVELMGSLSAQSSHKGDRVFARVVSPQSLNGDMVEGKVSNARAGGKFRGQSVLNFSFETLQHHGESIPISSQVKSIINSKGRPDVDEEGRLVRKTNNVAKAIGGTAVGGLIGGIAGGAKGAAIGAGAGAAASIILIEVATDGPDIRLDPGSRVALMAKSRSGPALTGLSPNPAPAPAAAQAPAQPATPAVAAPAAAPQAQAAPAASAASSQPDLTEVKSDFVPGEKTIFYDDFSDMAGDEPPPHWKVRGGSFTLKTGAGIRQLTTGSTATMIPNLKGLPKNFTVEADLKFDKPADFRSVWTLKSGAGVDLLRLFTQTQNENLFLRLTEGNEDLGTKATPVNWNDPIKLDWWLQNGRLRVYVNGKRQIDVNQVTLPAIASAEVLSELWGAEESSGIGYRMVRFAESTPDFSQVISSSGRYVTHGILFDTDSDRLKPESAPVIKLIAQGLQTSPGLKLRIEGHTDSTGGDAHNIDLSKRRAEAVKAVLVSQFGISADRLTTMGLGASKPIDSNDTPAGRAQNRRVEFVKM